MWSQIYVFLTNLHALDIFWYYRARIFKRTVNGTFRDEQEFKLNRFFDKFRILDQFLSVCESSKGRDHATTLNLTEYRNAENIAAW